MDRLFGGSPTAEAQRPRSSEFIEWSSPLGEPTLEFDVAIEAAEHNRRQFWARLFFALAAVPLWWLSFWIVFGLLSIPALYLDASRNTLLGITWGFMLILAWEGFRYSKELFDGEQYAKSFFGGLSITEEGQNLSYAAERYHGIPNPFSLGFVVSQFMLCAPRSVVNARKAHRAIVRANEIDLQLAQQFFDELLRERRWVDIDDHLDHADEMEILRKIGVLWTRVEMNRAEVRISAALTNRLYGE